MVQYDEKGLAIQDLAELDVSKLTPLSPEVISRQATINVGTIGHVAHGKSTVVRALSGVYTIASSKRRSGTSRSSLAMPTPKFTSATKRRARRTALVFTRAGGRTTRISSTR